MGRARSFGINGDMGDFASPPYHIIDGERIYSKLMCFVWSFYVTLYIFRIEPEIYNNRKFEGHYNKCIALFQRRWDIVNIFFLKYY